MNKWSLHLRSNQIVQRGIHPDKATDCSTKRLSL